MTKKNYCIACNNIRYNEIFTAYYKFALGDFNGYLNNMKLAKISEKTLQEHLGEESFQALNSYINSQLECVKCPKLSTEPNTRLSDYSKIKDCVYLAQISGEVAIFNLLQTKFLEPSIGLDQ